MSHPIALFSRKVHPGEIVPGDEADEGLSYRITMAAIDPSGASIDQSATLRLLRHPLDFEDDDSEDDDEEEEDIDLDNLSEEDQKLLKSEIKRLAKQQDEEEADGSDDEDEKNNVKVNGDDASDSNEMDEDEDGSEGSSGSDVSVDIEEFVVCSLKPGQAQQPLDLTISANDQVYFQVTGDLPVYLTGNYVIDPNEDDYDSEDDEYDLSPDEDELLIDGGSEEEDELDEIPEGKIRELIDPPKSKKRAAAVDDDSDEPTLDDLVAEAEQKPDAKLSRKDRKKLKTNGGVAAGAPVNGDEKADKEKSVKFAKNLEQGPSPSEAPKKLEGGVTIVDKKVGKGRKIKTGDKIGVRYIGKLENGKVFDSNKSGKPFRLSLGKGEVIKGWDIGLAGMALEGERLITIPAAMAYGKKGTPGIPPNSTLKFEVKLVEIK